MSSPQPGTAGAAGYGTWVRQDIRLWPNVWRRSTTTSRSCYRRLATGGSWPSSKSANRVMSTRLSSIRRMSGLVLPRRLTMDERDDVPTAWTPDGAAVLFFSSRNGRLHIFKQRVGDGTAELFVGGPTDNADPRVASDGKWVFFQQADPERQGKFRIMRVPIEGGQPERVKTYSDRGVSSMPSTRAVHGLRVPRQSNCGQGS